MAAEWGIAGFAAFVEAALRSDVLTDAMHKLVFRHVCDARAGVAGIVPVAVRELIEYNRHVRVGYGKYGLRYGVVF